MKNIINKLLVWKVFFVTAWTLSGLSSLSLLFSGFVLKPEGVGSDFSTAILLIMQVMLFVAIVTSYVFYFSLRESRIYSRIFLILGWLFLIPFGAYILIGSIAMLF